MILHLSSDYLQIVYKISALELLWRQLGSPVNDGIGLD